MSSPLTLFSFRPCVRSSKSVHVYRQYRYRPPERKRTSKIRLRHNCLCVCPFVVMELIVVFRDKKKQNAYFKKILADLKLV